MTPQEVADELSRVAGAGHLVMTLTKTNDWDAALEALKRTPKMREKVTQRLEEIGIDPELIDENTDIVAHQIRSPKVSTAICDTCNASCLYSGTVPKKCFMTAGCTGAWVKPTLWTIKPKPGEKR